MAKLEVKNLIPLLEKERVLSFASSFRTLFSQFFTSLIHEINLGIRTHSICCARLLVCSSSLLYTHQLNHKGRWSYVFCHHLVALMSHNCWHLHCLAQWQDSTMCWWTKWCKPLRKQSHYPSTVYLFKKKFILAHLARYAKWPLVSKHSCLQLPCAVQLNSGIVWWVLLWFSFPKLNYYGWKATFFLLVCFWWVIISRFAEPNRKIRHLV